MHIPASMTALSALAVLAGTHTATAAPIEIVNPGFEALSRPLAEGEQTNGLGGTGVPVGTRTTFPFGVDPVDWSDPVEVPGWQSRTVPFGSSGEILAGVLNPTDVGGTPFINGIEGDYALTIQAAIVGQATGALIQPNTEYTLSFLGGISVFDSEYFFGVTLTAIDAINTLPIENEPGVTRLAGGGFPDSGTQEADGVMRRYTLTYTTPEVLPAAIVGDRLGINLFGSDGLPRVVYDDFTLDARVIPAPSFAGVLVPVLVFASRRRARGVYS